MAIFQSSVLNKYLKQQDDTVVAKAYKKYTKYFHDATIQQNIKDSNEEQFQATFLNELFVKILGFTLNPQPKYNLTTEFKNVKNARKADGAILLNDEALAVIELKGTNTKDLESIRQQAFDYKANQPGCVYVVTSNFEKLRFYINNAVDFEEFDLFNLSYNRFELLYLCLHKDHLLKNVPLKIKEASLHEEEAITKKFYGDYSNFKRELFRDIVKRNLRNPELRDLGEASSKKALFKKTQKLLDRFLFIFFGEDRGLLPPNSIPKILDQWKQLEKMDAYTPLYDRYKKYFTYLNEGWKGEDHEIFAYNGGLFKPDPVLDSIEIDDALLFKHTSVLTKYDFESSVDVNILGHIFEHSLNEIESVNAEIDGVEFDKQKTKRKKDGVFYTPKYITKYIVDNTVGKLCEEKKAELEILEEEYLKGPKHRAKKTIKKLDEQIQAYRNWLLTLTICDPACGSGAFLNQALEFLIQEHRWIDEMTAKLFGGGLVFQDVENSILENNIYGVDLNDESVEIAKLSLWPRTAQKGRKLTSLNNNIKCGNSLIDSKAVAGDKAFKWEDEFPEVFAKGGFDVVIGNPPYGAKVDDNSKSFLSNKFECFRVNFDVYSAFIELCFKLLRSDGYWGFINPVSWQSGETYYPVRKYFKDHGQLLIGIKLPYDVFSEAYVDTGIYIVRNNFLEHYNTLAYEFPEKYKNLNDLSVETNFKNLPNECWEQLDSLKIVLNPFFYSISPKIQKNTVPLNEITESIRGILPNKEDVVERNKLESKPYFIGGLYRYEYSEEFAGVDYGDHLKEKPKDYSFFQGSRILIRRLINRRFRIMATFSDTEFVNKKDLYNLKLVSDKFILKYLLSIINSKLISFLKTKGSTNATKDDFGQLTLSDVRTIPIKILPIKDQKEFEVHVDKILIDFTSLNQINSSFIKYFSQILKLEKIGRNLQSWYDLDFSDFIKELNKAIKKAGGEKLSKMDEMEWMELFEAKKKEALELKAEIDRTDREIDGMVYELYGLTDEEVQIVENS